MATSTCGVREDPSRWSMLAPIPPKPGRNEKHAPRESHEDGRLGASSNRDDDLTKKRNDLQPGNSIACRQSIRHCPIALREDERIHICTGKTETIFSETLFLPNCNTGKRRKPPLSPNDIPGGPAFIFALSTSYLQALKEKAHKILSNNSEI